MAEVAVAMTDAKEPREAIPPWKFEGYARVPRPMRVALAPRPLRILFLYSRPPLPMTRGDELTVAHLLEFLAARGHEVDFLSAIGKGQEIQSEHLAWLCSRCRSVRFVEHGRLAALVQVGLGLLRGWPVQIGYLLLPNQLALAREAAERHNYDVAYAYYIRSAETLRQVQDRVPTCILALQLSQTLNTRRLARTAAHWWERLFYRFESRRMAAYEAQIWRIADSTVLIGKKDLEAIREVCRHHGQNEIDNVFFGPHGVDIERFRPRPEAEEEDVVVMSGVMRYAPNVEAGLWFLTQVWPLVRRARPNARFFLVGRDPVPALLAQHGRAGVEVTGTVEEPADWIARASVCVAPVRAAAGLQNKLLEALAMGKAMVATPEANEGIQAPSGEALLLAREPAAFAAAVLDLLGDPALRQRLGAYGRSFIEEKWTWEAPFLALERHFLALAAKQPAATRALAGR